MGKAYLIYHDSGEYESQIEPRIICKTRERAEKVVAAINKYGQKIARQLIDEFKDENSDPVSDAVWAEIEESNKKVLAAAKFPHSWEFSIFDFEVDWKNRPKKRFKSENIKIQELPLV